MLRKRSREMTENGSIKSTFFGSPRFFTGFSVKVSSEIESVMSPTSILDSKSFTAFINPFGSRLSSEPSSLLENKHAHHPFEKKLDSKGVGLGIVDALSDEETSKKVMKPESRMVLFGSQLKIQIPNLPPSMISPTGSPKSPADFGIKTRNSQWGSLSFSPKKSPFQSTEVETPISPLIGCLSASEMELSEDYTCVISRGPNPKTIHIFGDCIVENCCEGGIGNGLSGEDPTETDDFFSGSPQNFLSFCYNCKKKLGQGKDIYMYRGEKAFCSRECRYEEMLYDEEKEKI